MASEEGCGTNLDLSVAKADMHCRAARCFCQGSKGCASFVGRLLLKLSSFCNHTS